MDSDSEESSVRQRDLLADDSEDESIIEETSVSDRKPTASDGNPITSKGESPPTAPATYRLSTTRSPFNVTQVPGGEDTLGGLAPIKPTLSRNVSGVSQTGSATGTRRASVINRSSGAAFFTMDVDVEALASAAAVAARPIMTSTSSPVEGGGTAVSSSRPTSTSNKLLRARATGSATAGSSAGGAALDANMNVNPSLYHIDPPNAGQRARDAIRQGLADVPSPYHSNNPEWLGYGVDPLTIPIFGERDLAAVLDAALVRLAVECSAVIKPAEGSASVEKPLMTVEEIATIVWKEPPPAATATPATLPGAPAQSVNEALERERAKDRLLALLKIKQRTSQSIITELGKKLDSAQKTTGEAVSRVTNSEIDKAAMSREVTFWRNKCLELETKAASLEKAFLAWKDKKSHSELAPDAPCAKCGWHGNSVFDASGFFSAAPNARNTSDTKRIVRVKLPPADHKPSPSLSRASTASGKSRISKLDLQLDAEIEEAIGDSLHSRNDVIVDASGPPTEITRSVILQSANMLAAKKKYDPPTPLGVQLRSGFENELKYGPKVTIHPSNAIPALPRPITAPVPAEITSLHTRQTSSKRPYTTATALSHQPVPQTTPPTPSQYATNMPLLHHLTHPRTISPTHLSEVLRAQTRELLQCATPESYIRNLHAHLDAMTMALLRCVDALSEERRCRESIKARWRSAWKDHMIMLKRAGESQGNEVTVSRGGGMSGWRRRQRASVLRPLLFSVQSSPRKKQSKTKLAKEASDVVPSEWIDMDMYETTKAESARPKYQKPNENVLQSGNTKDEHATTVPASLPPSRPTTRGPRSASASTRVRIHVPQALSHDETDGHAPLPAQPIPAEDSTATSGHFKSASEEVRFIRSILKTKITKTEAQLEAVSSRKLQGYKNVVNTAYVLPFMAETAKTKKRSLKSAVDRTSNGNSVWATSKFPAVRISSALPLSSR